VHHSEREFASKAGGKAKRDGGNRRFERLDFRRLLTMKQRREIAEEVEEAWEGREKKATSRLIALVAPSLLPSSGVVRPLESFVIYSAGRQRPYQCRAGAVQRTG